MSARYGDLFTIASKASGICVIPVNTAFDTIVEDVGEASDGKPLVNPRTIHGQWVNRTLQELAKTESRPLAVLNKRIESALRDKKSCPVEWQTRGNSKRYPIGTIAPVKMGDVTYLLVALSEFDENNNAKSSDGDLLTCLASVLEWHRTKGQSANLYVPVMGTGSSSMGLDHQESFDRTIAFFRAHAGEVRGRVTVVVYPGDRGQVSIWGAKS